MTKHTRQEIIDARLYLDRSLQLLRACKESAGISEEGRRLSVAITQIELGCMVMNSSQFSSKPYSPVIEEIK